MKKLDKKAALNLSIQAIVILVIAFVVLGLALTLTRYIFGIAQEKAGSAIDIIEFEQKPTADNIITISKTVNIGSGKTKQLDIGVYNPTGGTYNSATLNITQCLTITGEQVTNLPSITAISQSIEGSAAAGYRTYLTTTLGAGNYICVIKVMDGASEKDSKQFSLVVSA